MTPARGPTTTAAKTYTSDATDTSICGVRLKLSRSRPSASKARAPTAIGSPTPEPYASKKEHIASAASTSAPTQSKSTVSCAHRAIRPSWIRSLRIMSVSL